MSSTHLAGGSSTERPVPNPDTLRKIARMAHGHVYAKAFYEALAHKIPELLAKNPLTLQELAAKTKTDVRGLGSVLRLLVEDDPEIGLWPLFRKVDGRFENTEIAEAFLLQPDLQSYPLLMISKLMAPAWNNLDHSIRTGKPAFESPDAYGESVFAYLQKHQEAAKLFFTCLADQTRRQVGAIVKAYDFSDAGTIVDVGGANGALLVTLLHAFPSVNGILFDKEAYLVKQAVPNIEAAGVAKRCSTKIGDFFDEVPRGDTMILKFILHDWRDPEAVTILQNCRRSLAEGGRLLIMEHLLEDDSKPRTANIFDATMLAMQEGGERSEEEYRRLLERAGLRLEWVVPAYSALSELNIIEAVAS